MRAAGRSVWWESSGTHRQFIRGGLNAGWMWIEAGRGTSVYCPLAEGALRASVGPWLLSSVGRGSSFSASFSKKVTW